jgi:hypothetical protein
MANKVALYKTEGIIIKAADLGELDRLLFVYTRGYGKITVRAISTRKKESKLRGVLETFSRGELMLAKSKTIDIVTDFQVKDSYSYLHKNLENLAYAYYFAELVDKLIPAPERDEDLWRLVSRVFEVLNHPTPTLPLIKGRGKGGVNLQEAFEDKLLEFLGHPKPAKLGKNSSLQRLNYFQSLAGEQINSAKFLGQIN